MPKLQLFSPARIPLGIVAVLSAGVAAAIGGVAAAGMDSQNRAATVDGVVLGLIAAIPLLVAFYACRRPGSARFGKLMLGLSVWWILACLSSSTVPLLYSIGRVSAWVAEVGLVYVLLTFPSGRLSTRFDRALMGVAALALVLLFLPSALLVSHYPVPAPWTSCQRACPHNTFMLLSAQPHLIGAVVEPVRELIAVLLYLAVALRLMGRVRRANRLMRHTLTPVLIVASARCVSFAAFLASRHIAPHSSLVIAMDWILAAGIAAIALAFVAGLVRWHLFVSAAIVKVHTRLGATREPQQVRDVVAEAFEDRELQLGHWSRKQRRWVATDGARVEMPAAGSGRHLTEVRSGRRRTVAIVHDDSLRDEHAFIDTAASLAATAFESELREAQTERILRELKDSRARILAVADEERRRIERDLHDGAQQQLVALRIELELAAEQAQEDDPVQAELLRGLGANVDGALSEIRLLTHGIYPAMLDRSLEGAVRAAASRCLIATSVDVDGLSSYPREIAIAAYFCIVETLQNVAKHARGASSAKVVLRDAGSVLRFSVSDDGVGFVDGDVRPGAGMINMYDRMATLGGQVRVRSTPGHGTEVRGEIPLTPLAHTRATTVARHGVHIAAAARQRRPIAHQPRS